MTSNLDGTKRSYEVASEVKSANRCYILRATKWRGRGAKRRRVFLHSRTTSGVSYQFVVILNYRRVPWIVKILNITSGLNEVNFPRKMRPRERSEQSWSIFQRWKFIWVEEPARLWNRLSPVMFPEPKVRASQSATSPTKGRGWRRVLIFSNKCKKQERSSIRFFLLILKSCTFEKKSKLNITSGLCEVQFPRKFRPREDFPHMDGKSEQRWRNFQS